MSRSAEVASLTKSAKNLLNFISDDEAAIEKALMRASQVSEKVLCMWEYENALKSVNSLTVNGSRRNVILGDLQRENRQILAYQDENRWLKGAVDECISTMNEVMNAQKTINAAIKKQNELPNLQDLHKVLPACAKTEIHTELRDHAMAVDDIILNSIKSNAVDVAVLARLTTENRVLKEMMQMAYLSMPNARNTVENAVNAIRLLERNSEC